MALARPSALDATPYTGVVCPAIVASGRPPGGFPEADGSVKTRAREQPSIIARHTPYRSGMAFEHADWLPMHCVPQPHRPVPARTREQPTGVAQRDSAN